MTHRQRIERWFDELWIKRNGGIIDEMVDPDCKIHGLPEATHGPAGFRPFYELFGAALARVEFRIDDAVEVGDKVAIRCTALLKTHDGKPFEFTGGGIVRFRDGRMIEAWNQWDFLGLLTAMGYVGPSLFVDAMKAQAATAVTAR